MHNQDTQTFYRFVVFGERGLGSENDFAEYHCLAEDRTDAVEQWQVQFPDCNVQEYDPRAYYVDDACFQDDWQGHGVRIRAKGREYIQERVLTSPPSDSSSFSRR